MEDKRVSGHSGEGFRDILVRHGRKPDGMDGFLPKTSWSRAEETYDGKPETDPRGDLTIMQGRAGYLGEEGFEFLPKFRWAR
jgi:hypothetical protein